MRGWSSALAILVLLAGCIGSAEDDLEAASADGPSTTETATAGSASATGGASSSASASATTSTSPDGSAAPVAPPVVVPLHLDGSFPAFASPCVFAVVTGACITAPPTADFNNLVPIERSGNVTTGLVTLTWTASSPLTEKIGISFQSHNEDFSEFTEHAFTYGASPLALELPAVALDPALTHRIIIFPGGTSAAVVVVGAGLWATTEQPFVVDGTISFAAPAAPPP